MCTLLLLLLACSSTDTVPLSGAPTSSASRLAITGGATIDMGALAAYDNDCSDRKTGGAHSKVNAPCVDHHFYVAPVRAGDSGPVQAWATCPSRIDDIDTCRALMSERSITEHRVLWRVSDMDTGWSKAIASSGLQSAPKAPVLLIE